MRDFLQPHLEKSNEFTIVEILIFSGLTGNKEIFDERSEDVAGVPEESFMKRADEDMLHLLPQDCLFDPLPC